jgi:hypothetical protein
LVWSDCGWRTRLGTCFYNRRGEAEELARLLKEFSTLVITGPRNVGKSELARYVLHRMAGSLGLVEIDARRARASEYVPLPREVAEKLARILAERAGLGRLLEVLVEAYRARSPGVLFLDEFHLASSDPLGDLEALAKLVAFYPEYRGWRLVLTTSEGWVMASHLLRRLEGYAARVYILEPMDEEHMMSLYQEYSAKQGCTLSWEEFWTLVGGVPGYLRHLCSMEPGSLIEWIQEKIEAFTEALVETGYPLEEALEAAYELLVEDHEATTKQLREVGLVLTRANIAYPRGLRFRPQLRIYALIAEQWRGSGAKPAAGDLVPGLGGTS